jgi:serine/threonine protein kinase
MPSEAQQLQRVVQILRTLGNLYLENGQYGEAAARYGKLVRLGIQEPEVHRNLALAFAGLKSYSPEAQRAYARALENFPNDEELCLRICEALLHNGAEDEHAQRCYEAALACHPPFAKDLYLQLHRIFHRHGKLDESFRTLKQALYLAENADDELTTRLTHLGWRYYRLEELIMTLRFLLGNDEANPTIRRSLAFTLAHAVILHRKQESHAPALIIQSEIDHRLIREFLQPPSSLSTLAALRDDCTLRLALLSCQDRVKELPADGRQRRENTPPAGFPVAFEYQSLLDNSPLEEVLSNTPSHQLQPLRERSGSSPSTDRLNWQRDFLDHLPCLGSLPDNDSDRFDSAAIPTLTFEISERNIRELAELDTEAPAVPANPPNGESRKGFSAGALARSLLVLAPLRAQPILQDKTSHERWGGLEEAVPISRQEIHESAGESPRQADSSAFLQKFLDLAAQHLAGVSAQIRIHVLSDGLLAFAPEPKILATAALELFQKAVRYNTSLPDHHQIVLRAALSAPKQSRLSCDDQTKEGRDENNLTGLEWLYDTLHLAQAQIIAATPGRGCLLMNRHTYESMLGSEFLSAKFLGRVYLGAPGLTDEIYEAIWYNPLDYADEKRPYALGRFLVVEKLKEWPAYGTYRARDGSLERPVVMKVLNPEAYSRLRKNEALHAEMINAIRRIGRLEHPGAPLIYDMGSHESIFFFVREYIEGESLAARLSSSQNRKSESAAAVEGFSPSQAIRLMLSVCRILRYASQHEVYHHNLKPANIWICSPASLDASRHGKSEPHFSGAVKVSDFFIPGFSETLEKIDFPQPASPDFSLNEQKSSVETSWYYTAPEWLFNRERGHQRGTSSAPGAAADVFSLGMILYECLCGEHPYAQMDDPAQLSRRDDLLIAPPTARISTDAHLPKLLDEVVLRAIHQDPKKRFQAVAEFEAALRAVLRELAHCDLLSLDKNKSIVLLPKSPLPIR